MGAGCTRGGRAPARLSRPWSWTCATAPAFQPRPSWTRAGPPSSPDWLRSIPGLLLLHRLPRHPIAWILTGSGLLWIVDGFASSWATYAIYTSPRPARRLSGVLVLLAVRRVPAARAAAAASCCSRTAGCPPRGCGAGCRSSASRSTALLPLLLLVAPIDVMERYHDRRAAARDHRQLELDPFSIDLPYDVWSRAAARRVRRR